MANCFGFCCFRCGRERRLSTPNPQSRPSHETPPPPSLDEVIAQLKAVNDVSNVHELIKIVRDFLKRRAAGEYEARSSRVALRFIGSGETFFEFLNKYVEDKVESSQTVASRSIGSGTTCGDIVNSAPLTIEDVLEKLGNVHWLVAGLSLIGYMLHTANEMFENYKRCLDLLAKMVDLADHVKKLDYRLPNHEEKLKRATLVIVKGCILFASHMSSHMLSRYLKSLVDADAFKSLRKETDDLCLQLISTPPAYPDDAVGLTEGQEKVIELLQLTSTYTARMALVIYGFGGIGKTTLAEAVVARIDLEPYQYARINFNIDSSKEGIKRMQEQILNALFPDYAQMTEREFTDCSQGRTVLTKAFKKEGNKPIFLFIDNALTKQDLDELLPKDMKGLPMGSRILVTTRDLGATDMFIEDEVGLERQQYVVQPLSHQEAKNFLLKDRADRQSDNIYDEDIERILSVCKGVPIVLKIVGGHFRKQEYRADKCSEILEKLKKGKQIKEEDLTKTLTDFVYDQWEESSRQAYMDICCFFYDMDPSYVEYIVGAQALKCLEEAAFVQRSDDKKRLIVHDIIRERGRNKAESTRIMNVESLIDAANEQRLKDIRVVYLQDEPECVVEEQHLKAMTKLRVLELGKRMRVSRRCEVTFKELRFLAVDGDIPCLPVNFERLPKLAFYAGPLFKEGFSMYKLPKELRVLIAARQSDFNESTNSEESNSIGTVKNSSVKELDLSELKNLQKVPWGLHLLTSLEILRWKDWDRMEELPEEVCQLTMLTQLVLSHWTSLTCLPAGFGRLTALKDLNLYYSKALQCLPESFGELKALESLDLSYCEALESLPKSFGQLKALKDLRLSFCTTLQRLPESFGELKALKKLNLKYCNALEHLPESYGELKALDSLNLFHCKALEALPESFGKLQALKHLDLEYCETLERLPESFGELKDLENLQLSNCRTLKRLPESLGELKALKDLGLVCCQALERLPESFGQLAAVKKLRLSHCTALQCLSESFGKLQALKHLDLDFCFGLERLPESFGELKALENLQLSNCRTLKRLPESFGEIKALKNLNLNFCFALERLPESFGELKALEWLEMYECKALEHLPESFGQLVAVETLVLEGCEALQHLPESFGELKALKNLYLEHCQVLRRLPESFGKLTALHNLSLFHSKALERLPESFGEFKALKHLNLSYCEALERLPQSFGELKALQYLSLSYCKALKRLPESFGKLTSLQTIKMADCPAKADLGRFEANLKHVTTEDEATYRSRRRLL